LCEVPARGREGRGEVLLRRAGLLHGQPPGQPAREPAGAGHPDHGQAGLRVGPIASKGPGRLVTLLAALGLALSVRADEGYHPAPENLKARQWFQEARFGLFIHWGVYSVLGSGEWVMHQKRMTSAEYERLPAQFHPVKFDPVAWVKPAKDAG